jgi:glycosyltransferase involved in cell wall biosynthesis
MNLKNTVSCPNRKLKVLQLLNYPGRGGTEKYILSLAEGLHNKSCYFHVAFSQKGPMLKELRNVGIKSFKLPMRCPYDVKAAWQLKKLCTGNSIDLIHTHFLRENYISILSSFLGNKVSIINTVHMLQPKGIISGSINSFVTRRDAEIIAVSNAVKNQMIEEGINDSKIKVIYNGVNISYWGLGRQRLKIREDLGIGSGDFVVCSVARFSEEKGHIFLMETIKYLKKVIECNRNKKELNRKVWFILSGDGELLMQCKKFAEIVGISEEVIFTGHRDNIKDILHASDLFVSHSKSEALGISILEAMACGLPVVATDSGGPSEIINSQTNCGKIVEYGDVEGFAEAILSFISDRKLYDYVVKIHLIL